MTDTSFALTFEHREGFNFGGEGWVPADFPEFDVATGFTMAHDVLEHSPDDDGSLEAEFRALGAMLYIRGLGGWFCKHSHMNPYPDRHLAADMGYMLLEKHLNWRTDPLPKPPYTRRLDIGSSMFDDDFQVESWIQEASHSALRDILNGREGDAQWERADALKALRWARGWIRIGYKNAKARWDGHSHDELVHLFEQITNGPGQLHGEPGDKLTITVDAATLEMTVTHLTEYDLYPESEEYDEN